MTCLLKNKMQTNVKNVRFYRHLNPWSELNAFKWSQNSPIFPLDSQQIEIIETPVDFYNKLKSLSLVCKKRITLSSLYIGTGVKEKDLLSVIESVKRSEPQLELNILLDYNRSTRMTQTDGIQCSTASLLQPLNRIGAKIGFYLTPNLSGWGKGWFRRRQKWNELESLHHIKCYIFDDNVIISGANLSHIYFTDRQDRYVLFKHCKQLSDYFDELTQTISSFSLQLQTDGQFRLHPNWSYDPFNYWHKNGFKTEAKNRITKLNERFKCDNDLNCLDNNCNTIAFPLIQMKTLGITDDQFFTTQLLANCSVDANIRLASGYFNLTERYKQIILSRKWGKPFKLLMASERANGFYGAKGAGAYIPQVYTHLTKKFLKEVNKKESNVLLYAFDRPEWSFHAKGLWLWLDSRHFLSMIGSPNFGYRSVYRDNEAQVVIVTTDQHLSQKLESECNHLWKNSTLINSEINSAVVPFWVSFVAQFIKSYF